MYDKRALAAPGCTHFCINKQYSITNVLCIDMLLASNHPNSVFVEKNWSSIYGVPIMSSICSVVFSIPL